MAALKRAENRTQSRSEIACFILEDIGNRSRFL